MARKKTKNKEASKRKKSDVQQLFKFFPNFKMYSKDFTIKQYEYARKLLNNYPDLEFWRTLNFQKERVFSLNIFFDPHISEKIRVLWAEYKGKTQRKDLKQYQKGDKIGEDRIITSRPKTIFDFLK